MTLNIPPAHILDQAQCANTDPEAFWPTRETPPHEIQYARRICHTCPVITECLEWAIANNEEAGIWGGTTGKKRRKIMANRRAGAA